MKVLITLIFAGMIFLASCTIQKVSLNPIINPTNSSPSKNIIQSPLPNVPSPTVAITPIAIINNELLPFSVYYLYSDNQSGNDQIFRVEKNGNFEKRLIIEQKGISYFKVSPIDGRILFLSSHNLILTDQNGKTQQNIAQGVYNMNWSPDGKTFAYWDKSLKLFSIDENKVIDSVNVNNYGSTFSNLEYSPDGLKIAIQNDTYVFQIINLKTKEIKTLHQPENDYKISETSTFTWSMNSKYLYLWESVDAGGVEMHGLWRFDSDGFGYSLFTKGDHGYPKDVTAAPWQDNNENLFYLLLNGPYDIFDYSFNLVRTNMDGNTNRTIIRPEGFNLSCSWPRPKWDPDGSGILIPESKSCRIERLIFVPIDPHKPIITLISDANGLLDTNWGP
jgi:dipeptidyl aminopeptidase/acylaminoacyl peptidase